MSPTQTGACCGCIADSCQQRWDAPRELFPITDDELIEPPPPSEEPELLEIDVATSEPLAPLPPMFETVTPPQCEWGSDAHPDLITSWMRTYGCQVLLVDLLLEVLLQSLDVEDPQLVLAGTSGFSLGQNGWIGHGCGPLRSCDLRLPLVISDRGPIREPHLTPSNAVGDLLGLLAGENSQVIPPRQWCKPTAEFEPRVETDTIRAELAVTTGGWSFVRDLDGTEHLFLKPDDVDDANDVARLRGDVVDKIR